jgi:hypothetical protein
MIEYLDKYRMYGLVPYNISPIQQGIQYGHALQEYNNIFFGDPTIKTFTEAENFYEAENSFNEWRERDKTFIILNGGTSMTMEQHIETLESNGILCASFREPDLNDMVSGIVFLVSEKVYKRDEWPDFHQYLLKHHQIEIDEKLPHEECEREYPAQYKTWVEMLGGEKMAFLKEFTRQFSLA